MEEKCPYCGSKKTQGVDHPVVALSGNHAIEQLSACTDCHKEFVTLYVFSKNVPVSESSRYSNVESQ